MKNFILNLQFIFMPSFWIMNKRYCPIHDKALNILMQRHKFSNYNGYTAYLGDTKIWVANYPFAVGIRQLDSFTRPSRLTILRMRKKLIQDLIYET